MASNVVPMRAAATHSRHGRCKATMKVLLKRALAAAEEAGLSETEATFFLAEVADEHLVTIARRKPE
jgi:hypothetical protein